MTDSKQPPLDDAELAQRLVDQAKADGVSLSRVKNFAQIPGVESLSVVGF